MMENIRKWGPLIIMFLHHSHRGGSPEVLLLPPSGTGQRGIWRRPLAAPPPSRTRRWRLPGGGCHRRPGCRCRWASERATTCAGPTSRPQTTGWRQSDPRGCPWRTTTTTSVGEKMQFPENGVKTMRISPLPAPGPGWRLLRVWWGARGRDSCRTPSARRPGRPPTVRRGWTRSRTRGATSRRWPIAAVSRPVGEDGKAGRCR